VQRKVLNTQFLFSTKWFTFDGSFKSTSNAPLSLHKQLKSKIAFSPFAYAGGSMVGISVPVKYFANGNDIEGVG
jgi:hypothetical protein